MLTMKKGEVALVTIAPEYAYSSTESTQDLAVVPPNSTVNYEVELVSFEKVSRVKEFLVLGFQYFILSLAILTHHAYLPG